jgi:signal transduction histidine kinase
VKRLLATLRLPRRHGSADAALLLRTRWRLIAWSGGTTLVALVVMGGAIYVGVSRSLAAAATSQLDARATQLVTNARTVTLPGLTARGVHVLIGDPSQPGVVFGGETSGTLGYVVSVGKSRSASDPGPIAILRAPASAATPGPGAPASAGAEAIPFDIGVAAQLAQQAIDSVATGDLSNWRSVRTTSIERTPVRVLSEGVNHDGDTYLVQVIGDRTAELRSLHVLLLVLGGSGVLILALSIGVGYVYAGRALVPVRESLRRQRDFAADASHEFRTPLAVVRASVEHLRRHPDAPVAAVGTALQDIDAETARLTGLVDQLLLLARTDTDGVELVRTPVDLADCAIDASAGLAAMADAGGVALQLDLEPAPLVGDAARLRQLVALLVDNAIRHSPRGGAVRVAARAARSDVVLTVEDDGPGIASADLPRIFDRFYRAADAPPGGSGLGLAIARWIAERHGGAIGAENVAGHGARFRVRIPASHAS